MTPPVRTSPLTGTRPLLKVSLHQDARLIAPWVVLISVLSASSILAYAWVFPDADDRRALAATLGANPALSLVFGPARDLSIADGFNAWRAGQLGAFFAGLMAILIVVRNSRANEDSGQAELIASGVIARHSRLAVAVFMAAIAAVALGVFCFVVTVLCGGGVTPTLILSATFTASALMFAGVAAVTSQLASEARAASSMAVGTLGVCYVLRGYIDSSDYPDWVTWLTPLGWLEETRPATENDPWPLLLALAFAILLVLAAFALQGHRDFGQGMVATRPGRARAGLSGNAWGLAFRLHRGLLAAWLVGFAGLGLLFGNIAGSIGELIAENPAIGAVLAASGGSSLTFAFVSTILQIIAIIAAAMGVQIVLRIHAEEMDVRVDPLLATALRRPTYLATNALVAFGATAVGMLVAGIALTLVAWLQDNDGSFSLVEGIGQAIVTIPGVWVLVALAIAVVGAAPAKRLAAWAGVILTFGLTILGPTFNLWDWVLDISPLRHLPNVSSLSPEWSGLLSLAGFIVVFTTIGFAGFRRRDIART
ncbi:MAG: hypothetical protein ABWX60_05330 [Aeromicrobium sp.]